MAFNQLLVLNNETQRLDTKILQYILCRRTRDSKKLFILNYEEKIKLTTHSIPHFSFILY